MAAPTPAITGPVRIRSRFTGASGPPAVVYSGEVTFNAIDKIMSIGVGDDGSGNATAVISIAGEGAFLLKSLLGAANGVPQLDANSKIQLANLPAAVLGAMVYQGTWNANTNSPALASGAGTKGYFYKVSVAGATTLDGLSQWNVGDLVLFDGATWDKIDGIASEVLSVAGRTGVVTLIATDISDSTPAGRALLTAANVAAQRQALLLDAVNGVNDANAAVTAATPSLGYLTLSAARVASLPALASMGPGQRVCVADLSGNCSATNTITITPNGSEKINAAATLALNQAYQTAVLEAKGGIWNIVSVYPPAATSSSGGVNAGQY